MTDTPASPITIKIALQYASQQLQPIEQINHQLEAEILLCHLLGKQRSWLYAWSDKTITTEIYLKFHELVQRRFTGEPVSHITGTRDFWNLTLHVTPDTLIPRHETELLVETTLKLLPIQPIEILELGTGSGAIAAAIASERPQWHITATDISASALAIAKTNFKSLGVEVNSVQSDWFSMLEHQRYHAIISNPPYIADTDPHLQRGDLRFEPRSALASGTDGLQDIRLIIRQAADFLLDDGLLILEHGYDQAENIKSLLCDHKFKNCRTLQDLAGNDRVSYATARA